MREEAKLMLHAAITDEDKRAKVPTWIYTSGRQKKSSYQTAF